MESIIIRKNFGDATAQKAYDIYAESWLAKSAGSNALTSSSKGYELFKGCNVNEYTGRHTTDNVYYDINASSDGAKNTSELWRNLFNEKNFKSYKVDASAMENILAALEGIDNLNEIMRHESRSEFKVSDELMMMAPLEANAHAAYIYETGTYVPKYFTHNNTNQNITLVLQHGCGRQQRMVLGREGHLNAHRVPRHAVHGRGPHVRSV